MTCAAGQTARVTVNGAVVGEYAAPVTTQITSSTASTWDYVFKGVVASGGCKTGYTVVYREAYDTYVVSLDFRSGQVGSCSQTVPDVRAKVSFGGQASKVINYFGLSAPSSGGNSTNFYPSGTTVNWHGSSVTAALPTLHSKTSRGDKLPKVLAV
ncbi:MAG: hypothetical protein RMY35_035330 [Nostoc sp. DedSLP01]|nr:hypothetical protein [Nostoc sp. DedSLP05]MDZ8102147.1 hypothetical protein [Nostoc sp. DedSLP01]